jgi:hypothetical protein
MFEALVLIVLSILGPKIPILTNPKNVVKKKIKTSKTCLFCNVYKRIFTDLKFKTKFSMLVF